MSGCVCVCVCVCMWSKADREGVYVTQSGVTGLLSNAFRCHGPSFRRSHFMWFLGGVEGTLLSVWRKVNRKSRFSAFFTGSPNSNRSKWTSKGGPTAYHHYIYTYMYDTYILCIYIYIYTYTHVYTHIYIYICSYICIYIYIHTCIHTYIHIQHPKAGTLGTWTMFDQSMSPCIYYITFLYAPHIYIYIYIYISIIYIYIYILFCIPI